MLGVEREVKRRCVEETMIEDGVKESVREVQRSRESGKGKW